MTYAQALEESQRLSKMIKREIEPRQVQCSCGGEWEACPTCAGDGWIWNLYFTFCDHVVPDGPDVECEDNDCETRERIAGIERNEERADPFVSQPLQSLSEAQSTREEAA